MVGWVVSALIKLDLEVLPTIRYIFGDLRAIGYGAVLRATYTFTRRLTLQTDAQPFLASEVGRPPAADAVLLKIAHGFGP
jgi:hypothetical protein